MTPQIIDDPSPFLREKPYKIEILWTYVLYVFKIFIAMYFLIVVTRKDCYYLSNFMELILN